MCALLTLVPSLISLDLLLPTAPVVVVQDIVTTLLDIYLQGARTDPLAEVHAVAAMRLLGGYLTVLGGHTVVQLALDTITTFNDCTVVVRAGLDVLLAVVRSPLKQSTMYLVLALWRH